MLNFISFSLFHPEIGNSELEIIVKLLSTRLFPVFFINLMRFPIAGLLCPGLSVWLRKITRYTRHGSVCLALLVKCSWVHELTSIWFHFFGLCACMCSIAQSYFSYDMRSAWASPGPWWRHARYISAWVCCWAGSLRAPVGNPCALTTRAHGKTCQAEKMLYTA